MRPDPKPEPRTKRKPKRLKAISDKRKARRPERRLAMVIVRNRDKFCQLKPRALAWEQRYNTSFPVAVPFCHGPLNGHEVRKSSHYPEDYYDPTKIVLLCDGCNEWVDDHNDAAILIGLRIPTSGENAAL